MNTQPDSADHAHESTGADAAALTPEERLWRQNRRTLYRAIGWSLAARG